MNTWIIVVLIMAIVALVVAWVAYREEKCMAEFKIESWQNANDASIHRGVESAILEVKLKYEIMTIETLLARSKRSNAALKSVITKLKKGKA